MAGKYKEIFNSDDEKYGGTGVVNSRLKRSKEVEWDDRPDSVTVKLAPLSASILRYIPYTREELDQIREKKAAKGGKKNLEKEPVNSRKKEKSAEKKSAERKSTEKKSAERKSTEEKITERKSAEKKNVEKAGTGNAAKAAGRAGKGTDRKGKTAGKSSGRSKE